MKDPQDIQKETLIAALKDARIELLVRFNMLDAGKGKGFNEREATDRLDEAIAAYLVKLETGFKNGAELSKGVISDEVSADISAEVDKQIG